MASWGDFTRSFRRRLSNFDDSLRSRLSDFDDSVRTNVQRLEDEARETYQSVEEQTNEFFTNPWDWGIKTFVPDVIAQPVAAVESAIGLGEDWAPPTPGAAPQAGPPGLDSARAARLSENARRRRRGVTAGANILSDRPSTSLGYTGGGSVSNILLGG